MSTPASQPSVFTVGAVFNATFAVLFRNLGGFVIFAVMINLGIFLIDDALGANDPAQAGSAGFVSFLLNLLGYAFLTAMVSYGTYRDLCGDRAGLGDIVLRGFSVLLPVLAVGVVTVAAYLLGLIALIVPGIFAIVLLWVAVPAAAVEKPGVIGALRRSVELTRGERWRVFGILMVFVGAYLVFFVMLGLWGFSLGASGEMSEAEIDAVVTGPATVAGLLFGMVLSLVMSVSAAVSYFLLRSQKEGVAVGDLAGVFD